MFKIGRAIKSYIRTNSGIAERNAFIDKVFRLLWETLSLFNKKTMKLYMTLLVKDDIINNSGGEFVKRLCLFAGFDKNNIIHDYVIYYMLNPQERTGMINMILVHGRSLYRYWAGSIWNSLMRLFLPMIRALLLFSLSRQCLKKWKNRILISGVIH